MEGGLQNPAITTDNNPTAAFTLPVGWRPVSTGIYFLTYNNGLTISKVRVSNDGSIKISKLTTNLVANSWTQLTGISYKVG